MFFVVVLKILKFILFLVCYFMGGEIFYNMSVKNEMLKMYDCI